MVKGLQCHQIKVDPQHLVGKSNPLSILYWRLEEIMMDLIYRLPNTYKANDSILMVADHFSQDITF